MKNLAIIGYGALGKILVSALTTQLKEQYEIVGILDIALDENEISINGISIPVFSSKEELYDSPAEIVVEIAGVGAVKEYAPALLEKGKDVLITSVGALANDELLKHLRNLAIKHDRKIHLTSGAIGGFDLYRTLSMMREVQASIESTKAPKSLNGAPYLEGNLLSESERVCAFEGSAREAISGFPKNTNVAVATGLATVGVDEVKATIISDPNAQGNTHKISVENEKAKVTVEVTAKPDEKNPKSSITAAWSVAALLANLADPIQLF
ncbi:DUF108 domain-containing protein [Peptoniphilus sp. KCTC 25270]|uniref:aspartate dehydrogenase domain-containing protein n=1 Tax=Peptoniphilus sp. KCTC 25270 TaxID=2897414 RepID=UPI001E3C5FEE|nr:aspartate dehydrogenase domain-containing protein [Peptoniphilus sp. KCTC 25270]MCD1146666.1 DUF108 domain-containing protein [Peptoniphilus sp. KCTC 25270]